METANSSQRSNLKEEAFEYKYDKDTYLIKIIFNSDQISFNIKNSKPYQYNYFESKFNFSDLKKINAFFCQFPNVEKIGNLYLNLLKAQKIKLFPKDNSLEFSFVNITEEVVNLTIVNKELNENEKLSQIVSNLVNDMQELKKENNQMKEKIEELMKFKLKYEEEEKRKKELIEKCHNFKNSSILKDRDKMKMISEWIMPNRNIIYTQIYKASKDGATGKDFHRCCDNKGPTVTLIESTSGYIFGGYISITWEGPSNWTYKGNDPNAFIFSVNNKCKYPIQDQSRVINNQKDYGPDFGSNDIYITNDILNNNSCQCNNYKYYNLDPKNVAGGTTFQVKELEIYLVQFN
jgi:hypothetical protein